MHIQRGERSLEGTYSAGGKIYMHAVKWFNCDVGADLHSFGHLLFLTSHG